MNSNTDLGDRVALITGASSGIGAATARELAAAGARLVLVARRTERLEALVGELGDARALAFTGDVNDATLAQRAIDASVEHFGRLDVVVNNAASFAVGPVEKLDGDRVAALARTNVEAAYRVAFEAIAHFKSRGTGDLINLSSISGTKVPRAGIGWYAGTKHALEALSESLRMECAGTGVRVSAIEPGMTQTEIFSEPITSIPRALDPEDVARTIRFVLESPAHVSIPRLMVLPSCQPI
ncbi:MAG: SDR family oxidoreductase [Gammaproteobacteria bacterium]